MRRPEVNTRDSAPDAVKNPIPDTEAERITLTNFLDADVIHALHGGGEERLADPFGNVRITSAWPYNNFPDAFLNSPQREQSTLVVVSVEPAHSIAGMDSIPGGASIDAITLQHLK